LRENEAASTILLAPSTERKAAANMKSFMILVALAIFGQIVAFTIAAHLSEHFSEDADTVLQEEAVGTLAPSSTLNMSAIPTV
jgi:hypothetical protein